MEKYFKSFVIYNDRCVDCEIYGGETGIKSVLYNDIDIIKELDENVIIELNDVLNDMA